MLISKPAKVIGILEGRIEKISNLDRWVKFTGKEPVREDGMAWSELKQVS